MKSTKFQRKELATVNDVLHDVSNLPGKAMADIVIKNKMIAHPYLLEIEKLREPTYSEKAQLYRKAYQNLVMDYTMRENGVPKYDNNGIPVIIQEKREEFGAKQRTLQEGHKEEIAEINAVVQKVQSFLDEEVEVKFESIDFEDISEMVNAYQLQALTFMINDKPKLDLNPN